MPHLYRMPWPTIDSQNYLHGRSELVVFRSAQAHTRPSTQTPMQSEWWKYCLENMMALSYETYKQLAFDTVPRTINRPTCGCIRIDRRSARSLSLLGAQPR